MIPIQIFITRGGEITQMFKWDTDQQVKPQFQQQIQQPAAQAKPSWEVAIEKLADHTKASFDATRQEIQKTNQNIQNIQATMKDLQQQIGQLSLQFSGREPGKFPSQTVPNPRGTEDCCAIRILRSGKRL